MEEKVIKIEKKTNASKMYGRTIEQKQSMIEMQKRKQEQKQNARRDPVDEKKKLIEMSKRRQQEFYQKIGDFVSDGNSFIDTGKKFGLSRQRISQICQEIGVVSPVSKEWKRKKESINYNIYAVQKKKIEMLAERAGMKPSRYMREVLLKDLK